ncbi:ER membrane protein complex subunit 8/9 homolog isoform X2 [Scaptodrosophila lebanonensis]|uniref:ER membrane protein complex subunit 8/9 homolog isoform X1 n=1 Tax=Drosophila lebanonensis TaxID=7225 RepID=A0A6J2UBX7_DROLE|nr:ER membrane protein complex subunit 8/9 homolog isoform X1 [Scaptodrosophila lebanonensis]XP_030385892.1 ER membrane protein complex subunit 8/9 homolog isoform X2 [Scaptodrosophila lebanonensis]
MCDYKISERAYTKLIFHAAKYPHLAVNGVLLGEKSPKGSTVVIVDAIPLFHQCLHVTPMAEIALMQIDAYAEQSGLIVSGYYAAAENFYDNQIERAPAVKIADKIQENNKDACFALIDNRLMSLDHERAALLVYNCSGEPGRWSKANYTLSQSTQTLEAVSSLLKRGAMRDVIDFDNHLDNPENDWTNEFLNKDLKQLLAMY